MNKHRLNPILEEYKSKRKQYKASNKKLYRFFGITCLILFATLVVWSALSDQKQLEENTIFFILRAIIMGILILLPMIEKIVYRNLIMSGDLENIAVALKAIPYEIDIDCYDDVELLLNKVRGFKREMPKKIKILIQITIAFGVFVFGFMSNYVLESIVAMHGWTDMPWVIILIYGAIIIIILTLYILIWVANSQISRVLCLIAPKYYVLKKLLIPDLKFYLRNNKFSA